MSENEAAVRRCLATIWQIRAEKQEAARERRIEEAYRLDRESARYVPDLIQRNSGKVDYEYREVV